MNKISKTNTRIAIIIVGLTRTFEQTYQQFLQNFILPLQKSLNVEIDLFLLTWNITGNIVKDKTLYHTYQSNIKWLDTEEQLSFDHIKKLKSSYPNIKSFKIINYQEWKKQNQQKIDNFIKTHNLQSQEEVVNNSLFGQYYAIQEAFRDFESYTQQSQKSQKSQKSANQPTANQITSLKYDLVIKTRFDLIHQQPINPEILEKVIEITNQKNQLISLNNWAPKGIEDKFLMGSQQNMMKYSKIFDWLTHQFNQNDLNQILLTTFYLPDVYMHFDQYNPTNKDQMIQIENEIKSNLESYRQSGGRYLFPIIPERFLLYYLQNIANVNTYWEEFIDVAIYRSSGEIKTNEALLKRLNQPTT